MEWSNRRRSFVIFLYKNVLYELILWIFSSISFIQLNRSFSFEKFIFFALLLYPQWEHKSIITYLSIIFRFERNIIKMILFNWLYDIVSRNLQIFSVFNSVITSKQWEHKSTITYISTLARVNNVFSLSNTRSSIIESSEIVKSIVNARFARFTEQLLRGGPRWIISRQEANDSHQPR